MATNLHIDEKLLAKAVEVGGHKTKKQAVTDALEEYIRHREQMKITELFGTVDYYPDYDPKQGRRKR
jgi:Arc/MetJ family transcription regulator